MFGKLISRLRKDDEAHPLSSEKRLAETLAEIRAEEGEGAVLDVDHWLAEIKGLAAEADGVTLRRAVERLDEFVQGPLLATFSAWLDSGNRLYLSDKGWQTLSYHYAVVGQAYSMCLADPDLPKLDDKTLLPRFAVRAMRAMVQGKKLLRLRHRAPDPDWWERAGKLLTWARERGASQMQVMAYPGEEPTSVWREYLVGAYLELVPADGMLQRQIELADTLLRKSSGVLVVRAQPIGNELYCLDPSSSQGPFRREPGSEYPSSVGFVGLDGLRSQIFRLVAQLHSSRDGKLPDWLAHTHMPLAQLRDSLHFLSVAWSADAPRRLAKRTNAQGGVQAVFGFGMMRRMAACSALARSGRRIDYDSYLEMMRRDRFGKVEALDELKPDAEPVIPVDPLEILERLESGGGQQILERWQLRDVSDGGIGVQMPVMLGRHAIGRLVGYRLVGEVDWRAGIMRRLRRDATGRALAGVEALIGLPICAQVKPLEKVDRGVWAELRDVAGHGFIDAVLLSGSRPELLLPSGTFSDEACYRMVVAGESRNVRLTTLLSSDDEYERVTYVDIATPPDHLEELNS